MTHDFSKCCHLRRVIFKVGFYDRFGLWRINSVFARWGDGFGRLIGFDVICSRRLYQRLCGVSVAGGRRRRAFISGDAGQGPTLCCKGGGCGVECG